MRSCDNCRESGVESLQEKDSRRKIRRTVSVSLSMFTLLKRNMSSQQNSLMVVIASNGECYRRPVPRVLTKKRKDTNRRPTPSGHDQSSHGPAS